MKCLLDYSDEEKELAYTNAKRRRVYYEIYNSICAMHDWCKSIYKAELENNYTNLRTVAQSVIEQCDTIKTCAEKLISLLDGDTNEKSI